MSNLLCHSGNWGSLGNFGVWGWIGLIFNLVLWVGSIGGLTLLIFWAIRRARGRADNIPSATEQLTAQESL